MGTKSKRSIVVKTLKRPLPSSQPVDLASAADSDEQYTPNRWYDAWNAEFQFTLDPCATRESAKCKKFYTKKQNGLSKSWRGERVWLNPPYSLISPWLHKVQQELQNGCPLVVALLPAWTDRKWWHTFIEKNRKRRDGCELRFIKGRIPFGAPGNAQGAKRGTGKFPSVLVIWQRPGYVVPDSRQGLLL